jgi:hypothetical protein
MSTKTHNLWGGLIAFIGAIFASTEFIIKWYLTIRGEHYDPNWWPVMLGMVGVFIGGFIMNSTRAKDAGNFVVTSAVRLIRVVRTGKGDTAEEEIIVGRRASDSVTVVTPVVKPETVIVPVNTDKDKGEK